MGHGFEAYDSLMLGSNKPAWHRLGNVIEGQPEKEEALLVSGLTWGVAAEPVLAPNGRGGHFKRSIVADFHKRAVRLVLELAQYARQSLLRRELPRA